MEGIMRPHLYLRAYMAGIVVPILPGLEVLRRISQRRNGHRLGQLLICRITGNLGTSHRLSAYRLISS